MTSYIKKMKVFLANQVILYMKLHALSWFIVGSRFFVLRTSFEKMYVDAAEIVNAVAERLLILEERPLSSLQDVLALATVGELAPETIAEQEAVAIVAGDYDCLAKNAAEILAAAVEAGDEGTADMFTGYLIAYQKSIWQMQAFLK